MEDESQTDGFPTNRNASNSRSHALPSPESNATELEYYDMTKEKILLIFNQEHFKIKSSSFLSKPESLPSRRGTKEDKECLKNVFLGLGFNVRAYNDLSRDEILTVIDKFVELDHKNTSCVVVAVMTHGLDNGLVYAYDGQYNISLIMSKFENKNLLQIPKLFLIQACRGKKSDEGHYVQLDGESGRFKIPTHGDVAVLYSTIEGYVSYRQPDGSWMIQTFCEVLQEYHGSLDILHIITLVNRRMSDRVSRSLDPAVDNKKQISETRYTLTKLLKF